ncbi:hypothetical protein [Serratia aquatilis]|uniref:Invasin domain-containing protein n=1 Tax=Serratia aquatilis TaxID=1737515 RepID=A0ABV6ED55_9GAMM
MRKTIEAPAKSIPGVMLKKRRAINLLVTGLMVTLPAQAILTNRSGQIQGRAPVASGNVFILYPDGTTKVKEGDMVGLSQKPNEFKASADTSAIVATDADGDTGLQLVPRIPGATLSWTYNNVALTAAQLNARFDAQFAGKTLSVAANVPVTASSTTGNPKTSGEKVLASRYTIKVPVLAAQIVTHLSANGENRGVFTTTSGFPTHGFVGATFQIYAESNQANNANYNWVSSHPTYAQVDAAGTVTFKQDFPSPAPTMVITATPKTGGGASAISYSFKVSKWWKNLGTTLVTWEAAGKACTDNFGAGYRIPNDVYNPSSRANNNVIKNGTLVTGEFTGLHAGTNDTTGGNRRTVGMLVTEWGFLNKYSNGWVEMPYYYGTYGYHSSMSRLNLGSSKNYFMMTEKGLWLTYAESINASWEKTNFLACVKQI